jgi:hypothetical protein
MSQRNSGYRRKVLDDYATPAWVTQALLPHLPARVRTIWEPAAGRGQMVHALKQAGFTVFASDISQGVDFLDDCDDGFDLIGFDHEAIVTNPPYARAQQFIERALRLTKPRSATYRRDDVNAGGVVAMLLRCDYDHAATRQHLFGQCPQFAKKLILTKRIVWFAGPKAAPSFNHAWFIWNWKHHGPPSLAYWQPDLPAEIRPKTHETDGPSGPLPHPIHDKNPRPNSP